MAINTIYGIKKSDNLHHFWGYRYFLSVQNIIVKWNESTKMAVHNDDVKIRKFFLIFLHFFLFFWKTSIVGRKYILLVILSRFLEDK